MSDICHIRESCSCGASFDFIESVAPDSWHHDHRCWEMQKAFQERHKACRLSSIKSEKSTTDE